MSLLNTIKQIFQRAVQQAFSLQYVQLPTNLIEITEATQKKFGHYQCNSAMKLTKFINLSSMEIAIQIKTQLLQIQINSGFNIKNVFKQIDIVHPGFINIILHEDFLTQCINQQLHDPRQGVPKSDIIHKVIIDFSSPNIAKEMHVGHLRSTIIGDCLARLLSFLGHDVLRLNHVGDWGTQFGMLIAYFKQNHKDQTNLNLAELVIYYREAKELFDTDPKFKNLAQKEVVALQNGEPNSKALWEQICTISKKAYQEIYDLLDIKIIDRGESFYNPFLADVVQALAAKNMLKISDGAKCVYPEGVYNRQGEPLPLIVQKSDGGYNYATTDLAALRHRVQVEKGTWLIYVTDAGQIQHFQMIFQVAMHAGFCGSEVQINHVPFGLVLRDDGKKFKTRSGDTEKLMDLLITAIDKAKALLQERNHELAEQEISLASKYLGINAIKYADLSNNRINNYAFSYDKMLQFEGNTAAFLSYAYVRIKSIQRKANCNMQELMATNNIKLQDPTEIDLALHACKFADAINSTAKELLPNRLTDYLFNLAEKFHSFFHQCKVINTPEQNSRLLLCEAILQILQRGFNLLGLTPLEKM
jgi:arginyl-tRNA synthetase